MNSKCILCIIDDYFIMRRSSLKYFLKKEEILNFTLNSITKFKIILILFILCKCNYMKHTTYFVCIGLILFYFILIIKLSYVFKITIIQVITYCYIFIYRKLDFISIVRNIIIIIIHKIFNKDYNMIEV